MLPCLVDDDDAGLMGGWFSSLSVVFVRPRPSYAVPLPLLFVAVADWPFVVPPFEFSDAPFAADAGTYFSIGESGGGGMPVPSVREKFTGVSWGSSNRPVEDLPLVAGILREGMDFSG